MEPYKSKLTIGTFIVWLCPCTSGKLTVGEQTDVGISCLELKGSVLQLTIITPRIGPPGQESVCFPTLNSLDVHGHNENKTFPYHRKTLQFINQEFQSSCVVNSSVSTSVK